MAKQNYKKLLIDARNLRSEAGKNAFRRTTLLSQVFNDRDFRADNGAFDDFQLSEILDSEVEDLCLTFLELNAMLSAFPSESDWSDGKLATLYRRTVELAKAAAPEKDKGTRRSVTIKDLDAETEKRKDAEAALRRTEKSVTNLESELSGVRQQLAAALSENERLKGRIEELEKILPRLKVA